MTPPATLVLALAVAGLGLWVALVARPRAERRAVADVERELALRADERDAVLGAWVEDRFADVRTIARFPSVVVLLTSASPAAVTQGQHHIEGILASFTQHQGLERVFVLHRDGRVVADSGEGQADEECVAAGRRLGLAGPTGLGVHLHADGHTAVQFVAATVGGGRVVAESPAADWLCPFASRAPLAMPTAEAILAYRDGGRVRAICAPSSVAAGQPLVLPVDAPRLAAAQALRGQRAFGRFRDHHDRDVYAVVRPTALSRWGLVLKVDAREVDVPFAAALRDAALGGGGLLVSLVALGYLAWRNRERRHELAIARALARQALILERANDAILFLTPDGVVLSANTRAGQLYGRPSRELVGLSVVDDLRAPAAPTPQAERLALTEDVFYETVHRRADGTCIHVEVGSTVVADETGRVVVQVIRDISEREAAHRRIARLNRLLRTRSEVGRLLLGRLDRDALLAGACRIAVEEGGFEGAWIGSAEPDGGVQPIAWYAKEPAAQGAREEVRWDDTPRGQGCTGRAVRERRLVAIQDSGAPSLAPWRSRLGELGIRSMAAAPIELRDGLFGTLTLYAVEPGVFDDDITHLLQEMTTDLAVGLQAIDDRRRREASEAQIHALFEHSPFGIAFSRPTGERLRVNAAMQRMLGYDAAELQTRDFRALTHPDDLAKELPLFEALGAGRRDRYNVEKRLLAKDGRTVWVSVTVSAVRVEGDAEALVIALVEDITERRQLREQYLQAQKMEGIGRLAGGVAHDFNNLLTAIMGYAELVREGLPAGAPERTFIGEVLRAGERASGLTTQLLAFARRQVVSPRVLDVNAVVTDAERMLRRLVGEDVELVTALWPGSLAITADPGQMQQVLLNLAVNARDAMPSGGRLTIETGTARVGPGRPGPAGLHAGAYVVVRVSDTGIGMAPEVLQHVFEPFFTTKEQGKGTGLGLATCHGIVTAAGGGIDVTSEPGAGTTFRLFLPATPADRVIEAGARAKPAPRGGSETILLAEDEPAVRRLAALSLRAHGYRVLESTDGADALRVADAHHGPIHLLVSDVVMPVMGGRDLAERFRGRFPEARILFVSGHAESAIAHHGVLDPGVALLEKPFTPERLARRVRDELDRPARSA